MHRNEPPFCTRCGIKISRNSNYKVNHVTHGKMCESCYRDEQLAKRGILFTDAPPMTVEQLIMGALIDHTDEHYGSIRKTVSK